MDASLRSRAEQLAGEMAGQATTVEDLNGLMRLMMKSALERMLDTEMDVHLGRRSGVGESLVGETPPAAEPTSAKRRTNRRNGRSQKTVQGDQGELTIATPRDRAGTFEPQLIGKHQRRVPGFDEKILALYAKGMTTRDIQDVVRQLYGVEVSAHTWSGVRRWSSNEFGSAPFFSSHRTATTEPRLAEPCVAIQGANPDVLECRLLLCQTRITASAHGNRI